VCLGRGTTPTIACNIDVPDLIRDVPREATQSRSNVGFSEAFDIISTALTFVNREIMKKRPLKIRQ